MGKTYSVGKTDSIERKIKVQGPIGRVWAALTVADQLAQWFGDSAEVDLRPGGAIRFGWSEFDTMVDGVIEEVDAPSTFSYRWSAGPTEGGTAWSTKVTFTLEESEGTTTVTVVESGLSELPDELYAKTLEENSSGWAEELADLARMLDGVGAV